MAHSWSGVLRVAYSASDTTQYAIRNTQYALPPPVPRYTPADDVIHLVVRQFRDHREGEAGRRLSLRVGHRRVRLAAATCARLVMSAPPSPRVPRLFWMMKRVQTASPSSPCFQPSPCPSGACALSSTTNSLCL